VDPTVVVVDTNILFAALLHQEARLREAVVTDSAHRFFAPRFVMVELFKHKERIVAASELAEGDLLECLGTLLARLTFVEEGAIPIGTWIEARRLCADVDPKDTPFVTLTLHLDGRLWTEDAELKAGLRAKGFHRYYEPRLLDEP
jgi:predicted nucleic acid-binding protein